MVVVHFKVEFTSPGDERGKRVLRQMARELLLMQGSDWPFLLFTVQAKEYTNERFHHHHQRFRKIIHPLLAQRRAMNLADLRFPRQMEAATALPRYLAR